MSINALSDEYEILVTVWRGQAAGFGAQPHDPSTEKLFEQFVAAKWMRKELATSDGVEWFYFVTAAGLSAAGFDEEAKDLR